MLSNLNLFSSDSSYITIFYAINFLYVILSEQRKSKVYIK